MFLTAIALLSVAPAALEETQFAETCKVESSRAPGEWKFVKVFDVDTGEIVLQQVIDGGASKEVTVSGQRMRVDWKLAGDIDYRPGAIAACKDGNTVKV